MNTAQYNHLFSFIWNIANDVLVHAFEKGEYKKIIMPERCRARYIDFKQDKIFNSYMSEIKANTKLSVPRNLYFGNPKSAKTFYYSTNVLNFFDGKYTKK